MRFEWDASKQARVLAERGVDLADMPAAFDDPDALMGEDRRCDYGEVRFRLIGEINGVLFTVAFTLRLERIRIITAWKAPDNEREAYQRAKAKN